MELLKSASAGPFIFMTSTAMVSCPLRWGSVRWVCRFRESLAFFRFFYFLWCLSSARSSTGYDGRVSRPLQAGRATKPGFPAAVCVVYLCCNEYMCLRGLVLWQYAAYEATPELRCATFFKDLKCKVM